MWEFSKIVEVLENFKDISITANFWIILFIIAILIETILQIIISKKFAFGRFTKNELNNKGYDIRNEIREYSTRALNLSGLTFASLSLLFTAFSNNLETIKDALLIMTFGLFLFIVSYKLDVFSAKKRIIWCIQQRLINYGLLTFAVSMFILSFKILGYFYFAFVFLIIISILHLKEYLNDYKLYKIKYKKYFSKL